MQSLKSYYTWVVHQKLHLYLPWFIYILFILSPSDTTNTKPYFGEKIYHGEVNKTTGLVSIHPQLIARDEDVGANGEIAEYLIDPEADVPFIVTLGDSGEAILKAVNLDALDCLKSQDGWRFSIQAMDKGMPQRTSHRLARILTSNRRQNWKEDYILLITINNVFSVCLAHSNGSRPTFLLFLPFSLPRI